VLAAWGLIAVLTVGGYCALRFTAEKTPPPVPPPTPAAIRPILFARAVAEYAGLLVAPITLRMERDVSTRPQDSVDATLRNARAHEYETLAGVLLIIGFIAWWRHARRAAPVAALCLGAFLVAYVPISNVVSLNATIAEHWLYVPSAFLFLAVALTVTKALVPSHGGAGVRPVVRIALAVGIAWAVALGVRTFLRQEDWRDQRTFIERTITSGGDSARMCMNLGNVESSAGRQAEAVALYRQALHRAPDQALIWLGFANVLLRARDFAAARDALEHAKKSPFLTAECDQLRAVLDHVEFGTDSGDYLRAAMDFAPKNWGIRKYYLEYLIQRGDLAEAARELRDFIEQHPFRGESWKLLGGLLESMQRPELAGEAYRQAVLRDVHDEDSLAALARLHLAK
jgi:cytochrome c-type biogenesis protein CcmH/NrfG